MATDPDVLVETYLYLVDEAVGRNAGRCRPQDLDDLRSDAQLALVEASRQFREDGGASFRTFARRKIGHAIIDGLRNRDCLSRTHRAQVGFGRFQQFSLDALESTDDLLTSASGIEQIEQRELVERLLRELPGRQREAVSLRFLEGLKVAEVGDRMGISRSGAAYLIREGLAALRTAADQLR
jgi:RNA polymerase sigma factor (sigma-70 family)